MKNTKDLLSIDFNKYKNTVINGVVIFDTDIVAQEDSIGVALIGKKDEKIIFRASFFTDENIRIKEITEECISIRVVENRREDQ